MGYWLENKMNKEEKKVGVTQKAVVVRGDGRFLVMRRLL